MNILVWKTKKNCTSSDGGQGVIKQVLELEGGNLERDVNCFDKKNNGALS